VEVAADTIRQTMRLAVAAELDCRRYLGHLTLLHQLP
jgi:hypothetical protein